jgi:hypothetical protein
MARATRVARMTRTMPPCLRNWPRPWRKSSRQGGSFRHREHIHLAYLAVQWHGADLAAGVMSGWIRQLAAYQRAPQKFNATVTRAWTEIVAHHMAAAPPPADFASFADRYPALLDKRLLTKHYTARTLASPAARKGWAEPDLLPFPMARPSDGAGTVPPPKGPDLIRRRFH